MRHGSNKEGNVAYSITVDGIRVVERALQDRASDLSYFSANGDDSLPEVAGLQGIFWFTDEIPEIADWRPIEVDQNDPTYEEAVSSVEEAIRAIEESNEIEVRNPEEKVGILRSLGDGMNALKSGTPTRAQISDLLLKPLKWVATTFAESFVGQAAKNAAQKLVDLILAYF